MNSESGCKGDITTHLVDVDSRLPYETFMQTPAQDVLCERRAHGESDDRPERAEEIGHGGRNCLVFGPCIRDEGDECAGNAGSYCRNMLVHGLYPEFRTHQCRDCWQRYLDIM